MNYDADTLRKLQLVELDILREVDALCKRHEITYFLDSGTALGAMRHDGFIPWDDDIDIGMLRPEYERFLSVAANELGDKFEVSDPVSNSLQSALFTKIWLRGTKFYTTETLAAGIEQGVGIDVFPYDVLDVDAARATKQVRKCNFWQKVMYLYHSKDVVVPHKGLIGKIERGVCAVAHPLLRAFTTHEALYCRFSQNALSGSYRSGENYICMAYVSGGMFPRDVLVPPIEHIFEKMSFPMPAQSERYLEIMFGDWRIVPPVEQRRQHVPVELCLDVVRTAS